MFINQYQEIWDFCSIDEIVATESYCISINHRCLPIISNKISKFSLPFFTLYFIDKNQGNDIVAERLVISKTQKKWKNWIEMYLSKKLNNFRRTISFLWFLYMIYLLQILHLLIIYLFAFISWQDMPIFIILWNGMYSKNLVVTWSYVIIS